MKLSKLTDPQFQATLRKLAGQEIPLRTAFTLKGIIKRVNDELNRYDEVRHEALEKLGERDADGKIIVDERNNVKLSDENMNTLAAELNSLLNTDVDVGNVKLSDLGDKLNITTNELIALDDLIVN
jgi:hypothetical protein